MSRHRRLSIFAFTALVGVFATSTAVANDSPSPVEFKVMIDTVWVLLAAILVFFMNTGFGLLEAGLCRSKNTVNILAKNFAIAAVAGLAFYVVGFGLMFGDGNAAIGLSGFFLAGADNSPAMADTYAGVFSSLSWSGIPLEAKFFFQVCFAMTAASIVSGAVAERIRFQAFIVFSLLLVALVYSISGHWIWGGGWLAGLGFWDFAGSTQVHSVGGWAALTGVYFLGARQGKYEDGEIKAIPGHNLALATAGGFILWLGWFGFNAGSTMAADPASIAHICATTMLASLAGIIGAMSVQWMRTRKVDLPMMINGALAGLVAITAGCAFVSTSSAILIGLIGGLIVVPSMALLDALRLDDAVGAISVHLVCGIWGTLAVGLFAQSSFSADVGNGLLFGGGVSLMTAQVAGVLAVGAFVGSTSSLIWWGLKRVIGIRVDAEEEEMGLDLSEMGMEAYPRPTRIGSLATPGLPAPAFAAAMVNALPELVGGGDGQD